jgi:Rrf2 family protein
VRSCRSADSPAERRPNVVLLTIARAGTPAPDVGDAAVADVSVAAGARNSSCRLRAPGNGRARRLRCRPASDERARRTAGLSYNYLLTIVAELRRAGFVKMRRRPGGGLQLARPAHTITLSEIICAIDGPLTLADGSQPTNPADQDSSNRLPALWFAAHQAMLDVFARVTLSEASLIGVQPPIRRRVRRHRVASAEPLLAPGSP